jgi:hypothetical protein
MKTINTAALGGLLTAGVLAATSMVTAPTGNASCFSAFGIGNTAQCQSGPTSIAIALGDAAVAQALGAFSLAIANGLGLPDPGTPTLDNSAVAVTGNPQGGRGAFSLAYAAGTSTAANVLGNFSAAIAMGARASAAAWGDFLNVAINVGVDSAESGLSEAIVAGGVGNVAAIVGGRSGNRGNTASAYGRFNVAANLFTDDSSAEAGFYNPLSFGPPSEEASFSAAFNVGGSRNTVRALRGPVAIAGAVNRSDVQVTQDGPGTTINDAEESAPPAATLAASPPSAQQTAASGAKRAAKTTRPATNRANRTR